VNLVKAPRTGPEPKELSWMSPTPQQAEWLEMVKVWVPIELVPNIRLDEKGAILHNLVFAPSGRVCSNSRRLNDAVKKLSISMPSLKDHRQTPEKGDWMLKIDVSKFYWAVRIKPSHRKYFRFRVKGKLHQWRVLPFGYRNSMQILDRIMKPVVAMLATMGIKVISWVDDFVLLLGKDKSKAEVLAQNAMNLLTQLGFVINQEKTSTSVTQEVTFRGFVWNTRDYSIRAPAEKYEEIAEFARTLNTQTMTPRKAARLVGKIRYVAQVHRTLVARLVELEIWKKESLHDSNGMWDRVTPLPKDAKVELKYWQALKARAPEPMTLDLSSLGSTKGDAGPHGYGFEGNSAHAGIWTAMEAAESTNFRELDVWDRQAEEFIEDLEMVSLSVYETDSMVAAVYINKIYGKVPRLARKAAKRVIYLEDHGTAQMAIVVSQQQIQSSDNLSRLSDKWDWQLSQRMFKLLCKKWAITPTIDLMASRFSRKVKRFYSKRVDSEAVETNAFVQAWRDETAYVFPPTSLIQRTVTKLRREKVLTIIIVPKMTTLPWYQSLTEACCHKYPIPTQEITYPVQGCERISSSWIAFCIRQW
jgi:hypothetical protein